MISELMSCKSTPFLAKIEIYCPGIGVPTQVNLCRDPYAGRAGVGIGEGIGASSDLSMGWDCTRICRYTNIQDYKWLDLSFQRDGQSCQY